MNSIQRGTGGFCRLESSATRMPCIQTVKIMEPKLFGIHGIPMEPDAITESVTVSPLSVAITPCQCVHYCLTRPAVVSVLGGYNKVEELQVALAYETTDDSARDYAAALSSLSKHSYSKRCIYCGHCAPCPVKIDVASVNKYLNLALSHDSVPETVAMHYETLEHRAGECLKCGSCERNCPFDAPVIERMELAKKTFGY